VCVRMAGTMGFKKAHLLLLLLYFFFVNWRL
jgi:hypothetical protein